MTYNLLVEPWIPVLWKNGKFSRVGIWQALTDAGRIRQIAASNPMDNVALLRFLLAVLLWCKPSMSEEEKKHLAHAEGIPEEWLADKLASEGQPSELFDLLGDGFRFYQDAQLPTERLAKKQQEGKKSQQKRNAGSAPRTTMPSALTQADFRPIGDLLVEFPTDTKIAHFRHVRDKEYGLCPACCALGIIRHCAFANYAGKGYTTGINGPAPAYAVPQASTLLETLLLSWPNKIMYGQEPPWLSDEAPSLEKLDVISAFAWRARRLWLAEQEGAGGACSYCGQEGTLIKGLLFGGGWKQPFESKGSKKKLWDQDPHLILVEQAKEANELEEGQAGDIADEPAPDGVPAKTGERTALGFPRPGHRVKTHVGFRRRALVALLDSSKAAIPGTVLVAGPATSQTGMLYQDATALHLTIPPDREATASLLAMLGKVAGSMDKVLRRGTPNPKEKHLNRKAALDGLSPTLEEAMWAKWEASPGAAMTPDQLVKCVAPFIDRVVESTTAGSPLRRRDAQCRARVELRNQVGNALAEKTRPQTQTGAMKEKRGRRKRGGA
ncbi:MAG: type I-E CRISPR-associated protein Cse1/CasA [Acidobacteriota bacterium]